MGPESLSAETRQQHGPNLEAQGLIGIVSAAPLDGVHGMEPGALQLAVFQNRAVHHAQEAKGTFVPFRNSALSTYVQTVCLF